MSIHEVQKVSDLSGSKVASAEQELKEINVQKNKIMEGVKSLL